MGKLLKGAGIAGVIAVPSMVGCALVALAILAGTVIAVIFGFFAVILAWLGGELPDQSGGIPAGIHGSPASGIVTATYHDPDYFSRFGVQHEGIDIANNAPMTFLYNTVENGVVSKAGYDSGGYGFYMIITDVDSGWTTLYAHMLAPGMVAVGDTVTHGDRIGIMGRSGNSTGVHVHYEIRKPDKTRVDPELSPGCCG